MEKHCVVLGGGGWMMGELPSQLDQYILSLVGKNNPKVCYLSTATGDSQEVITRFHNAKLSEHLTHFPLFKLEKGWRTKLLEQDVIYVGGGNTRSMLALWKEWGIDDILKECYNRGIILCGMSAGAICWFDYGITDSDPEAYSIIKGIGLLRGLASAHFIENDEKHDLFERFAHSHLDATCYGLSDYAALHFVDGKPSKVIYSSEDAQITIRNGNDEISKR
ncbi:Type 1 glutamine amidotransferase-like domain-containing protein [Vibrio jasicida]|uniref:Type 1 glutamine amidotransferase-like domain-containing protein n=1 Tax=Vibrio jasicida TaxID=766224 RepID=UPI00391F7D72